MNARKLLRWYPRAWRERYGEEFLAMVEDSLDGGRPALRLRLRLLLGVAIAGLRERGHQARQFARRGVRRPNTRKYDTWSELFVAGLVCALLPTAFRTSPLPARAGQATAALDVLAATLALAAAIILAGGLTALPAFFRFVRAGGWPEIRRRVAWAAGATAAAGGALTGLILVTRPQNSGLPNMSWAYFCGAYLTAALLVVAVAAWTSAVTATAKRLDLTARMRAAEKMLAAAAWTAASILMADSFFWFAAIDASVLWLSFGVILLALWSRRGFFRLRRAARSGRGLRAAARAEPAP